MSLTFSVIFLAVFLGFSPGLFWFWFYRKKTLGSASPKTLATLFVGGMASTIPAAVIQYLISFYIPISLMMCLDQRCDLNTGTNVIFIFVMMFLVVGPIEEYSKYVVLKWIAFKKGKIERIIDGVKYSIIVALGFASLENALYLIQAIVLKDYDALVSTLIIRFFISTLAHTLYAGIMGYYLGLASFNKLEEKTLRRTGLILAIITHGAFNFLLFTNLGFYAIILVAVIFLALLKKFKSKEVLAKKEIPAREKSIEQLVQESKQTQNPERSDKISVVDYCPKCFMKNLHRSKYCPNCGEKLYTLKH